jgi:hypothetical protein
MVTSLLLTFAGVCAFLLLQGMLRRGAIYEYPFLAGATFASFALPQLIGLSHDSFLPAGALEATLIMASLSALMCWLGAAMARPSAHARYWVYDERRLLIGSVVLSLLGAYFYHALSQLPPEMLSNTQWTGLPVAYLFFARMLTYGFAVATLLFARSGSRQALLLALFGASFYFDRIVISGRRGETVEFCTIILMAWWFQRNRCLPRPVMLLGIVLGSLFINSIVDYRNATMTEDEYATKKEGNGPRWDHISDQVFSVDFIGNLERLAEHSGPELTNAAYTIAAVNRRMEFDLGIYHWNQLIFSYVPAQIVGADLKNALYLPESTPAYEEYFYVPLVGSTETGLSDAFRSFWYFGCLKFFLIAFVMQKLWLAARAGSITAELLYMLLPAWAMEAITHTTHYFVIPWVHISMFLLPALFFARRARPTASGTAEWQVGRLVQLRETP